jgi:hypothetical protein
VEWCDNVLYLKKNADGHRILLMDSDDTALAKNRLGKSGEIDTEDQDINEILMPKGDN